MSAASKCEHKFKDNVCVKCGHAETWKEYMKRMEATYGAYISR